VNPIFDIPGPRGKRMIAVVTAVSVAGIMLALWWAYHLFEANGQLAAEKWAAFGKWPYVKFLLKAFGNTAKAAGMAGAMALPAGLLLALGRMAIAPEWEIIRLRQGISFTVGVVKVGAIRVLRWVCIGIIEFFRAVPLLLVIYVFLLVLPGYGFNPGLFWKLVVPIAVCAAATIAEVFRAGVLALPKGQSEAGAAVGLTDGQTFWRVLLPQAVRVIIPTLVSQIVILVKDTTLGYVVSYDELQHSAQVLVATGMSGLVQTYFVVAVLYVVINVAISAFARGLDSHLATRGLRPDALDLAVEVA
jgi:glutamate transport system permease protein